MTQRYRSEKNKTGANCTGTDGTAGRTYTLANGNVVSGSSAVYKNSAYLYEGSDYTISGTTITFIDLLWDDNVLDFIYFTDDAAASSGGGSNYATTLAIVKYTGIGVEVFDEILGTGNSTEASFDLDNGNIIDNSYVLRYGPATGVSTNNLINLTETTHYNIDIDAGRVLLTAAGITLLGTNKLYASYVHCPKMSNTFLETFLEPSDREVDGATGAYWGTPIAATEYFDGSATFTYPTTDQPFAADYDEPDELQLPKKNVTSVDGVYFLAKNVGISKAYSYDLSTTTYVDRTSATNTPGETGYAPFAAATGAGDYLYIGSGYRFHGLQFFMFTNGVTSGTNTIEYWNGTAWTAFTPTESTTGVLNFESTGKLTWTPLASWTRVAVNGSEALFYVRVVAGSTYSTEPILNTAALDQSFIIMQQVAPYTLDWDEWGRIVLNNNRIPNGSKNIRVDYHMGKAAVPALITEISALYSGLRIFANITGGSYDDATHYQLGRKEVTIGETYVNVREVVDQLRNSINELFPIVGKRFAFKAV